VDRISCHAYLRAMGITPWVPRLDIQSDPAGDLPEPGIQPVTPAAVPAIAARTDATADVSGVRMPDRPPVERAPERASPGGGDPESMDWRALQSAVADCRACGLCETRTQTVFGVGNREAALLVIGEAPGADEDREGEPFVGRAGQLLNRMLAAIGLPRQQVYIANILKCRPPGNRDPRPEESLRCQPFLMRQIALVRPRVILTLGRISAQTLLGTDVPVGRLRGRWYALGPDSIPLRVTYHPAYLLRSPEQKGKAWEDLTAVVGRLS
jgi:DNA polymerase